MLTKQKKWTAEHQRQYMKLYRKANYAAVYARIKQWKLSNPIRSRDLNKLERSRLKEEVFLRYSIRGVVECAQCRFNNIDALCLDHINNDGAQQRKEAKGKRTAAGTSFYRWLKKNNYPEIGLQVLCANCNIIKELQWRRK